MDWRSTRAIWKRWTVLGCNDFIFKGSQGVSRPDSSFVIGHFFRFTYCICIFASLHSCDRQSRT